MFDGFGREQRMEEVAARRQYRFVGFEVFVWMKTSVSDGGAKPKILERSRMFIRTTGQTLGRTPKSSIGELGKYGELRF